MHDCPVCGNTVPDTSTGDYCNDCMYTTLEIAREDRDYWNDKYDDDPDEDE